LKSNGNMLDTTTQYYTIVSKLIRVRDLLSIVMRTITSDTFSLFIQILNHSIEIVSERGTLFALVYLVNESRWRELPLVKSLVWEWIIFCVIDVFDSNRKTLWDCYLTH